MRGGGENVLETVRLKMKTQKFVRTAAAIVVRFVGVHCQVNHIGVWKQTGNLLKTRKRNERVPVYFLFIYLYIYIFFLNFPHHR